MPPLISVEPPLKASFSTTRVSAPASAASAAAATPVPPPPMISTSVSRSKASSSAMATLPSTPDTAAAAPMAAVPFRNARRETLIPFNFLPPYLFPSRVLLVTFYQRRFAPVKRYHANTLKRPSIRYARHPAAPNSQPFPSIRIPNSQFSIPNSQFLIPNSQFPKLHQYSLYLHIIP